MVQVAAAYVQVSLKLAWVCESGKRYCVEGQHDVHRNRQGSRKQQGQGCHENRARRHFDCGGKWTIESAREKTRMMTT